MASADKSSSSTGQPLPGWVWLLTGLIIGLSATFFPRLNEYFKHDVDHEVVDVKTLSEARDYTFYTLLPEVDALVEASPSTTSTVKKTANQNILFVLQIGSFNDKKEAQRLIAELAALDVTAKIQDVRIDGKQWFRVTIGPSQDKVRLNQVQKKLAKKHINSRLFQVRS